MGNPPLHGVDDHIAFCEELLARRGLKKFYKAARDFRQAHPEIPVAWVYENLANTLTNRDEGVARSYGLVDEAVEKLGSNLTDAMLGDMLRDLLIGTAIHLPPSHNLMAKRETDGLVETIAMYHREDPSRLACLEGVEGQLAYARGEFGIARTLHVQADAKWAEMPADKVDADWRATNKIRQLRATVAEYGCDSHMAEKAAEETLEILRQIERTGYEGVVKLLLRPYGRKLYDQIRRSRGKF